MQPPTELSKAMANKKNKWKNACRGKQLRGKYKRSSKPDEGKPNSGRAVGGCRIVNMDQLQKFVVQVSSHSRSCKNGSISLTGERYREGLASVLSATCSGCRMEVAFPTSSKVTGLGGGQRWECNLAAVWGQMSTGGGHVPLATYLLFHCR